MARRTRTALTRPSAFWDASSLVPLCVPQASTIHSLVLHKAYDVVVWWAAPVEIASAISRLLRMKQLDAKAEVKARRMAVMLSDSWSMVQPSDGVLKRALQLVTRYELRAGDSLQLAAAWEWSEGMPSGKLFLTQDQKLRDAALLCGFQTK